MNTPWSHLANADLIDWVLESLRIDSEKWTAAWDAAWDTTMDTARNATMGATLSAALRSATAATRDASRNAIRNATLDAALRAIRDAAREATWNSAHDVILRTAHDVILALIAYDDCDQYLQMSYEQLLAWAILSERPQAVLLLSMKWIQEHECLVTSR